MSEHEAGNGAARQRRTARVLRERLGGVPHDVVERNQARIQNRRRIVKALGQGPRTVPEVALATRLASHEVLWHVMAMKKVGIGKWTHLIYRPLATYLVRVRESVETTASPATATPA